jgi:hypothetical protein
MRIGQVAAESGLSVGPCWHELEVGAAPASPIVEEPGDGDAALVFVRLGRHREPGVVGEQRHHALDVAGLRRGCEPPYDLAFPPRWRE